MIEILYSIAATAILIAAHTLALSMPFSHNQARTTARLCMIEKALAGLTPRTRSNRMAAFSFIDGPVRNKTIHCDTHEAHGCCRDQFAASTLLRKPLAICVYKVTVTSLIDYQAEIYEGQFTVATSGNATTSKEPNIPGEPGDVITALSTSSVEDISHDCAGTLNEQDKTVRHNQTGSFMWPTNTKESGYLLLETLLTIGILSIGLLGISAMQLTSMKSSYSAVQRGETAILIAAMSDRIRANPKAFWNKTSIDDIEYNSLPAGSRARQDIEKWETEINSIFGVATDGISVASGSVKCVTMVNCILTIEWNDLHTDAALNPDGEMHASNRIYRYKHAVSVIF